MRMLNPKVSIVLPVYNGEKYLKQSIDSILNQTYDNLELIIVNDCSTDSSEDIIRRYLERDNRIIYVMNSVNSKLPKTLNNGFKKACGDYYTWTSDDNLFHRDAIEKMVNYLESYRNVDLVYCDYNIIDGYGEKKEEITVRAPEYLKYGNVIGACFLYRKSVVDEIGEYAIDKFLVEDYEYWLRISLKHRIMPLHECLYDYRIHGDSLTTTRQKEIKCADQKLKCLYLKKYEKNNMPNEELFDYFEYIQEFEPKLFKRIKHILFFSVKHPQYIKRVLKKIKRRIKQ